MGRLVIGGFGSGNVTFNLGDTVCRAMQNVILTRLGTGNGLFFRYAGAAPNGDPVLTAMWIGPSTAIRFEYDSDVLPELDLEMVSGYQMHVDKFGGIVVPSEAELEQYREEDAAEAAVSS